MSDAGCHQFFRQPTKRLEGFGKYSEWDKYDILSRLEPLFQGGWKIDPFTQMITIGSPAVSFQTPWWHHKVAPHKECGLWHQVIFNYWRIIPAGCQECWKVVVRPRTVTELFQLRDVQKKLDLYAKCGIEVRSYTPAHYGGYFYNDSLDQGRDCYKTVRAAVDEMISPDVKVILKRACTEMELQVGPSPFWKVRKEDTELEEYLKGRMNLVSFFGLSQPDYMEAHLFKRWVMWAYSRCDETYRDWTGGRPLYDPPVVYHEANLEEIKRDLEASRLESAGIAAEKVHEVRDAMHQAARECGLAPGAAGAAFGHYGHHPLYPQEFIGEDDRLSGEGNR